MADNKASGYPELQILTDRPLIRDDDDYLGFGPYADALALILDNPETYTPLTLAISAPWGAGKTSLANMVERRLATWPADRGDFDHIICWFNAWMHDDAPHLGSAFAAEVAKTVSRARPWWRRLLNPVPSAMLSPEERWMRRVKIGIFCFAITVMAVLTPSISDLLTAAFSPTKANVDKLKASLGVDQYSQALFLIVAFAAWKKFFTTAQAVARFIDDPKSEAAKGAMQQVRTQLARLIHQATRGRRRLVIFVDDLERCRPPRSIEVCEVASQLLGHRDVATVLIADMSTVATSAQIKYSALEVPSSTDDSNHSSSSDRQSYGRSYLQKIVQIQFDLPTPQPRDVERMMTSPFNTEASLYRRRKRDLPPGVRSLVRRVRGRFSTTNSMTGVLLVGLTAIAPTVGIASRISVDLPRSSSTQADTDSSPFSVLSEFFANTSWLTLIATLIAVSLSSKAVWEAFVSVYEQIQRMIARRSRQQIDR